MSNTKLPFLQDSKWPVMVEREERVVNPSSDAQFQDHLVDEILVAREHKDSRRLREALISLIHSIRSEDADAM